MNSLSNEDRLNSIVCNIIRFPLAFMVVALHSFGSPSLVAPPYEWNWNMLNDIYIYDIVRIFISFVVTHVAVPLFYIISGYYFFYKMKEWNTSIYITKMKKRIKTLLIPYLVWITLFILLLISIKYLLSIVHGTEFDLLSFLVEKGGWHLYWDSEMWGQDKVNWLNVSIPSTSPILIPMWFIRDLIVITVLSPLVYWFIKKARDFSLLFFICVYITQIWIPLPGFKPTALLFWGLGAYLAINGLSITQVFYKKVLRYTMYTIALLLLPVMVFLGGTHSYWGFKIYPFFIICATISFFNLMTYWVRTCPDSHLMKWFEYLSPTTFFIFALHTIYVTSASPFILNHLLPVTAFDGWLSTSIGIFRFLLSPFLTVTICLLAYYISKKILPKALFGMLVGGR